jgi:hypothetical protein
MNYMFDNGSRTTANNPGPAAVQKLHLMAVTNRCI